MSVPMRRVSIVGTSGAGKSTLGAALARPLGADFLELDSVFHQTELWNGNREHWRNLFRRDKEESVIAWAWQTHATNRTRYAAAMADTAYAQLRFVRLKNPAEVRRFLSSVSSGSGGD